MVWRPAHQQCKVVACASSLACGTRRCGVTSKEFRYCGAAPKEESGGHFRGAWCLHLIYWTWYTQVWCDIESPAIVVPWEGIEGKRDKMESLQQALDENRGKGGIYLRCAFNLATPIESRSLFDLVLPMKKKTKRLGFCFTQPLL